MNFMDMYFIDLLSRLPILSFVLTMIGVLFVFIYGCWITYMEVSYKFVVYIGCVLVVIGFLGMFLSPSQELIELLRGAQQ